jgi:predicted RNase H-like nuclease (RuvC/YqgF family)
MAILGLDAAPGGSFAYAVLDNGTVVERGVSDARAILRLLKRYRVKVIAVDSMSELLASGRAILGALARLPYDVSVVEVTRDERGYRRLEELVGEHFGVFRSRLEPPETAEYLAALAARGAGTAVRLFEEETVILVYRKISPAAGGMSHNRFVRNVSHRIRSIAARIEAKLKSAGLDYDLFIRKESGEITSAKFVVYAGKEVVRRYVRPMRSIDVSAVIYSTPARGSRGPVRECHLIVGVDPGAVTGIAVLTLSGEVLDTVARRGLSRGDIIRYVHQWGIPVMIATDVSEAPEFVRKLAAMCGAALYTPSRDLTTEEKARLVERLGVQVRTSHERDALAAAYKAYQEHKQKFERLEREFGSVLEPGELEYAKALIVRGLSVAQAVSEAIKRRESREVRIVRVTVERPRAAADEGLLSRVRALEYENQQLRKELDALRAEYAQLRRLLEDERWRDVKYRELQMRAESLARALSERDAEIERLKRALIEILINYGTKYRIIHASELVNCNGSEPYGSICKNVETIEEAVARGVSGVPLRQVARLQLGEFYVVDAHAVRELTEVLKKRVGSGERVVDLRRVIEEYRRGLLGG